MFAPVFLIASGVRSSGSTLMPPLHTTISQPFESISRIAAVIFSWSSFRVTCSVITLPPNSLSFSTMTGVKVS